MRWMSRNRGAIRARVPGPVVGGRFAQQLDLETAFPLWPRARPAVFRVFVQFNVAAQRQPLLQIAMMNDQNFVLVNDEDSDGVKSIFSWM